MNLIVNIFIFGNTVIFIEVEDSKFTCIQFIFLDKFYIYLHNIQKDRIFPYNSNSTTKN